MAEKLCKAEVIINNNSPVRVSGGSLTKKEAMEIAKKEALEFKRLGFNKVKGQISEDRYPARWIK